MRLDLRSKRGLGENRVHFVKLKGPEQLTVLGSHVVGKRHAGQDRPDLEL